jgi:hypothetical protein
MLSQGYEGTHILSPFSDWRLVRVPLGLDLLQLRFFLRLHALSPYIYLTVYYLCPLQMPMSSSCSSPATNMYARLFPSLPALRNLGSGEARDEGHWFVAYGIRSMARHRLSIWPFPYHGVDSICFYHFYVPITHPSVIAKIIVLFLCCFGC